MFHPMFDDQMIGKSKAEWGREWKRDRLTNKHAYTDTDRYGQRETERENDRQTGGQIHRN